MTFLSEASETMAGHISTAEQEAVPKKCKVLCDFKENFGIFEIMFFLFQTCTSLC